MPPAYGPGTRAANMAARLSQGVRPWHGVIATAVVMVASCQSSLGGRVVPALSPVELETRGCYVAAGLSGAWDGLTVVLDTLPLGGPFVRLNRLKVGSSAASGLLPHWSVDPRFGDSVLVAFVQGRVLVLAAFRDSLVGTEYGVDDFGRRWPQRFPVVLRRLLDCPIH